MEKTIYQTSQKAICGSCGAEHHYYLEHKKFFLCEACKGKLNIPYYQDIDRQEDYIRYLTFLELIRDFKVIDQRDQKEHQILSVNIESGSIIFYSIENRSKGKCKSKKSN